MKRIFELYEFRKKSDFPLMAATSTVVFITAVVGIFSYYIIDHKLDNILFIMIHWCGFYGWSLVGKTSLYQYFPSGSQFENIAFSPYRMSLLSISFDFNLLLSFICLLLTMFLMTGYGYLATLMFIMAFNNEVLTQSVVRDNILKSACSTTAIIGRETKVLRRIFGDFVDGWGNRNRNFFDNETYVTIITILAWGMVVFFPKFNFFVQNTLTYYVSAYAMILGFVPCAVYTWRHKNRVREAVDIINKENSKDVYKTKQYFINVFTVVAFLNAAYFIISMFLNNENELRGISLGIILLSYVLFLRGNRYNADITSAYFRVQSLSNLPTLRKFIVSDQFVNRENNDSY